MIPEVHLRTLRHRKVKELAEVSQAVTEPGAGGQLPWFAQDSSRLSTESCVLGNPLDPGKPG